VEVELCPFHAGDLLKELAWLDEAAKGAFHAE